MSYSLLDWVEIWQFFIPRRLELLKTHHCALDFLGIKDLKKMKKAKEIFEGCTKGQIGKKVEFS